MSEEESVEDAFFRYECACCKMKQYRIRWDHFEPSLVIIDNMTFCGRCLENYGKARRFEGEKSRYKTLEFYTPVDDVAPEVYQAFYDEHFPQYAPKAMRKHFIGYRDTTMVKLKRPPGGALVKSALKGI